MPDWGQYLAYLHAFLFGRLGDLTYDFATLVSRALPSEPPISPRRRDRPACARRPGSSERERIAVLALIGMTAYGVAIYSYFDNRSTANTLINVALPALLLGGLWLGLLLRSRSMASRELRRGGLAFGLAVAVLLVAVAWSSISERFPRSALAYAIPGGKSVRGALQRLGTSRR